MTFQLRRCYTGSVAGDTVERLIHHMPTIAERAENDWARGFAQSICQQSRRRGWHPSPKQLTVMHRLVKDLFRHGYEGGDFDLIE